MRPRKYTAAIIGTGRIGFTLGFDKKREQPASHTMALLKNRRIRLIAGCDSDKRNLSKWEKFNRKAAVYTDSAHLFACTKSDIVVVSVNESSHLSVCLQAIRAKPLLVILEKPVALNTEEGKKILDEARLQGVSVLVNHERRFARDYAFAKEYMKKIGSVMTINARLDSGLRVYSPDEEESGGYSLLHDGTHLVDIVQYLLEDENSLPGEKVLSDMRITSLVYDEEKSDVVRNVSANFSSKKCPDVNISISGRSKYFGFEVEVIGTEGRFKVGNGIFEFYKREESSLYTGFYSLVPDKKAKKFKKTLYFSNMVKNAVDFLDGKAPLRSTVETGLKTLEILEEIKDSVK